MDATLNRLRVREIPPVPAEVVESFKGHKTTLVPFEDRIRAISEPSLRTENGVAEFPDGSFMVSVSCPMHGVTKEMLTWWVWWFPQDTERFRAWLPESNLELTYAEDDADYFHPARGFRTPPWSSHTRRTPSSPSHPRACLLSVP